jgi:hypothetical protein
MLHHLTKILAAGILGLLLIWLRCLAYTPFNNGGSSTINNWNTAAVTDMGYMFFFYPAFNQNIQ